MSEENNKMALDLGITLCATSNVKQLYDILILKNINNLFYDYFVYFFFL